MDNDEDVEERKMDEERPTEAWADAVLLACSFSVQCLECGATYTDEFSTQDEDRDWEIQCEKCTEDKGFPVFIPLAAYAGDVVMTIESLEAETASEEQGDDEGSGDVEEG